MMVGLDISLGYARGLESFAPAFQVATGRHEDQGDQQLAFAAIASIGSCVRSQLVAAGMRHRITTISF